MKYPQEFYSVVSVLCLLRCLYPPLNYDFQWLKDIKVSNSLAENPLSKKERYALTGVKSPLWGLLAECERNFHHKWPDLDGMQFKAASRSNLTVFIYTDVEQPLNSPIGSVRRNLTDSTTTSVGRQANLSLEDIDLIDCLWRQDIDAEKGFFASIQPPENQHETDLFLLNEKDIIHGNRLQLTVLNENRSNGANLYSKYFGGLRPSLSDQKHKSDNIIFKSFESQAPNASQIYDEKIGNVLDDDFDPSFFNLLNATDEHLSLKSNCSDANEGRRQPASLLRNVTLASVAFDDLVNESDNTLDRLGESSSNVDILSPPASPISMNLTLSSETDAFNILSTPSLMLTDNDVVAIFADNQVVNDVVQSFERRESPAVIIDQDSRMGTSFKDTSFKSEWANKVDNATINDGYEYDTDHLALTRDPVDGSIPCSYPLSDTPSTSSDLRFNPSPTSSSFFDPSDNRPSTSHASFAHDHAYCAQYQAFDPQSILRSETPCATRLADTFSLEGEYVFEPSLKDEYLVELYNIHISAYDIINMPYERLQMLLSTGEYGIEQMEIARKIRRRGRNKVAARNCRQRRVDAVQRLSIEVDVLELELKALMERRRSLEQLKRQEIEKSERLSAEYLGNDVSRRL